MDKISKSESLSWMAKRRGWLLAAGTLVVTLIAAAALFARGKSEVAGHKGDSNQSSPTDGEPAKVHVVQPTIRDIVRVVGQPSFVEAYERTSIYPKVTGFIENWTVDIGDKVKKGDVLGVIYVPELREDWETKKATVELDTEKVDLARKVVKVAEADVKAAEARLKETREILDKYKSDIDRWDLEVKRLKREVDKGVVDPQVLLESQNQLRSNTANWSAAQATVEKAEAQLLSIHTTKDEDEIAVRVAQAELKVAISEAKRLEAWVSYLTLNAPFDGVITARNANTWDFVAPKVGDPSADDRAPHLSPSGTAAPIYVVDRVDVVRVFMDVPERDAKFVGKGTSASVYIEAFRDYAIPAQVSRTSWALNFKSRTLRAEIDLENTEYKYVPKIYQDTGSHPPASGKGAAGLPQILPGMYAYAKVNIKRQGVLALPRSATFAEGDKALCWTHDQAGNAQRLEIRTGLSDDQWIEVTNYRKTSQDDWHPFEGPEQVLVADDLGILSEGAPVQIEQTADHHDTSR